MSTHLADHYNQAWLFAARAHRNQTLSGSPLPYLVHLGMVANELLAADRDGAIERLGKPCRSRSCTTPWKTRRPHPRSCGNSSASSSVPACRP